MGICILCYKRFDDDARCLARDVCSRACAQANPERFEAWLASYHEAGHAVAMLVLNLAFASVSIIPDGASVGRVAYRRGTVFPTVAIPDLIRSWAIADLAGDVAREIGTGVPAELGNQGGLTSFRTGRRLFGTRGPNRLLEGKARAILEEHWWLVENLVSSLRARRELTLRDCLDIAAATGDDLLGSAEAWERAMRKERTPADAAG
jgi:hypothetical protein